MCDMDYVRILRDLREDADKTQTQIAQVLGTSQTMYARYDGCQRAANSSSDYAEQILWGQYRLSVGADQGAVKRGQEMQSCPRFPFFWW